MDRELGKFMTDSLGPAIIHEVQSKELMNLFSLPRAKIIETPGLHGITTLQAVKVEPEYNGPEFVSWREVGDFQFKMMLSPNRRVIRLELYDPMIFSILLEQLLDHNYRIVSSGEDVEFTPDQSGRGGWLGWAHLVKDK